MIEIKILIILVVAVGLIYLAKRSTKRIVLDSLREYNAPKPMTYECADYLIIKKKIKLIHEQKGGSIIISCYDSGGDHLVTASDDNFPYRLLECYGLTTNNFVRNKKGKVVLR